MLICPFLARRVLINLSIASLFILRILIIHVAVADSVITIDADKSGPTISPLMYGLMIEDISHSIDGGLYAELVRNRNLRDSNSKSPWWTPLNGTGSSEISVDTENSVEGTALTNSLKVRVIAAGVSVGVANLGYWGAAIYPGERLSGSVYAKSDGSITVPPTVSIISGDGKRTYASTSISAISRRWRKYLFTLIIPANTQPSTAEVAVCSSQAGSFWITQLSVFPPTFKGRDNGMRSDLADALEKLSPSFLRFPGGNFLEGTTVSERFEWKDTVGPIDSRPGHHDPWGYRSTDGFGLLDYVNWCDDMKLEPVLGIFAGYSLSGQYVPAGPQLAPYVQDALDEIQYLTGDSTTKWGALRIADGHPRPVKLHYIEVGNEDFFDKSGSYDARFAMFYDAIRAAYPALQIIATTDDVKSRVPDIIDDHFYFPAAQFEADWKHYDKYSRTGPKIFVGEFASSEGKPIANLRSALGDAAFRAGFDRDADVVKLTCYAPLLVDINKDTTRGRNLIGFDCARDVLSPAYYVEQIFSQYHGDSITPASETGDDLPYTISSSKASGRMYLKIVNAAGQSCTIHVNINGVKRVEHTGDVIELKSPSDLDTNTYEYPAKVAPIFTKYSGFGASFNYQLSPYSLTVIVLSTR